MAWSLARSIHRAVYFVNSMMDLCVVFSSGAITHAFVISAVSHQCARARTDVNWQLFASSSGSILSYVTSYIRSWAYQYAHTMPIVRKYMGVFYQSPQDHHP